MRILIACEESQEVCKAFREKGHEAYSCDIAECSGGHPEWHIHGDALPLLNGNVGFQTMDGTEHYINGRWDLLIAHPPCTYLTVSGNRWFNVDRYGTEAVRRAAQREEAVDFFMQFVNADCDRIAIENPVGVMSTRYRKPDQIIQPYQFGHPARKGTCLWLKNLPCLLPTNVVAPEIVQLRNGGTDCAWHIDTFGLPAEERRKMRSKTFHGIALAIADQWGGLPSI